MSSEPAAAPQRRGSRWRGTPLRGQLVGILLVLLTAALAVTGYGVQLVLRDFLVSQIDDALQVTARNAADDQGFQRALISPDRRRFPSPFVVQVDVDGGTEPVAVIRGYTLGSQAPLPNFPQQSTQGAERTAGLAYGVRASDGSQWRAVSFPSAFQAVNSTTGASLPTTVTILQSMQEVDEAVSRLRQLMVAIGAVALVACGVLGWAAIRRSFVPLREVEDTAAAIAAGDLSRRIPERPATTEVGSLTASLNGMLTQIEDAFRAREASEARTRRFAADASHELRTPLASIRGFAELHRSGAVPPEEVSRVMRRIEDEATRMGGLVEDLLLLARLDEQRPGRTDPVDLAVLAGDAVHDARGLDADRQVRLVGLTDGVGPMPAMVTGDEDRLRQVVANLVANAVRHTPPGTPIEVAVGTAAGRAVVEVRDHGAGLPPEVAEKVFERFYRLDSSRQRGRGGGSGLGLSIVAAVVAAHHGSVEVRPTPGGGATFAVQLPLRVDAPVSAAPYR